MQLEISQSSILAAREIVKDSNIVNANKRLHEHHLSSYEYSVGKKVCLPALRNWGKAIFCRSSFSNNYNSFLTFDLLIMQTKPPLLNASVQTVVARKFKIVESGLFKEYC